MTVTIRRLTVGDLGAVDRIQRLAYPPDFLEDAGVFADKLAHYPVGCWVGEAGGSVVGYLISHPACFSAPPEWNKPLGVRREPPDCYFIHDLAVVPAHRGKGAAALLVASALSHAAERGFSTVALIAVQNSERFWERAGFRPVREGELAVDRILQSYGPEARYMVRRAAFPRGVE